MKIFSFDAESNGLWGDAFAIAAVVLEDGKEVARYTGRCPISGDVDPYVRDNIIPRMEGMTIYLTSFRTDYHDLLREFAEFYMQNKGGCDIVAHCAIPVESKIIADMHTCGYIGDWDAPFPLIEVAGCLIKAGHDPKSVDSYAEEYELCADGEPHNPLYDARITALVYDHLINIPPADDPYASLDEPPPYWLAMENGIWKVDCPVGSVYQGSRAYFGEVIVRRNNGVSWLAMGGGHDYLDHIKFKRIKHGTRLVSLDCTSVGYVGNIFYRGKDCDGNIYIAGLPWGEYDVVPGGLYKGDSMIRIFRVDENPDRTIEEIVRGGFSGAVEIAASTPKEGGGLRTHKEIRNYLLENFRQ